MSRSPFTLLRQPYRTHGAGAWLALFLVAAFCMSGGGVATSSSSSSSSGYTGPPGASAFQQCVIQRESSGNPTAVNPDSGAGGLYQFLPSTWHELGYSGLAQNASIAEQNRAFDKAYAKWGTQPWAPSDGC